MSWKEFFKPDWRKIVLTIIILIICTLVTVRLFSAYVRRQTLPSITELKLTYDYEREVNKCKNICENFLTNTSDLQGAVAFCQQKVPLDIDGNYKVGEKGAYNFIGSKPYCEDGIYCFHIYPDCKFDDGALDPRTCLKVMCRYYSEVVGFDEETSWYVITKKISYGTCEPDPRRWSAYPSDIPSTGFRADWWYVNSGYNSTSCKNISYGEPISFDFSELKIKKQKEDQAENLSNKVIEPILIILFAGPLFSLEPLLSSVLGIFAIPILFFSEIFYWYFLSCLIIWIYDKVKKK
jgi:hypothetical protein